MQLTGWEGLMEIKVKSDHININRNVSKLVIRSVSEIIINPINQGNWMVPGKEKNILNKSTREIGLSLLT